MYQSILVPLDGSKQAESALLLASKLARIYNAELTLLRVVEYPIEMYARCAATTFAHPGQPNERLLAEKDVFCKEAEEYLQRLVSIVEMNVANVSIEIQEYPVVEAMLSTVLKFDIDLIVMSSIGQNHNSWMMGAITNRILREAPVPVILFRKESWVSLPDRSYPQETSKQDGAWLHPDTLST